MHRVGKIELQGVLARRQLDRGFGLTATEMDVMGVGRNRLVERRQAIDVDQQVMMAGVVLRHAGRGNAHATQAEAHVHILADRFAILR